MKRGISESWIERKMILEDGYWRSLGGTIRINSEEIKKGSKKKERRIEE